VCYWYCSGAFIKVVFEAATNTIKLSGPAAAVDTAFNYIQSNYIDAMCHEDFHLCLPGNWFILIFCMKTLLYHLLWIIHSICCDCHHDLT